MADRLTGHRASPSRPTAPPPTAPPPTTPPPTTPAPTAPHPAAPPPTASQPTGVLRVVAGQRGERLHGQQVVDLVRREGPGHVVPLTQPVPERGQPFGLGGCLDALGYRVQSERVGDVRHRGGHRGLLVRRAADHEGLVQLENVYGTGPDQTERRLAGAEVVEGQPYHERLEGPE